MTAAECIEEIVRVLRDESSAENKAQFANGRIDSYKAAELRVAALREIEATVEKFRVYGERA